MARIQMGAFIRAKRERRELTMKQTADLLGWHILRLHRLETGKQAPTVDDVRALAKFYNVDEARLFGMSSGPTRKKRAAV